MTKAEKKPRFCHAGGRGSIHSRVIPLTPSTQASALVGMGDLRESKDWCDEQLRSLIPQLQDLRASHTRFGAWIENSPGAADVLLCR